MTNVTFSVICYKSKVLANGEDLLMLRICKDGKTSIWMSQIDQHDNNDYAIRKEDILQKSKRKGFLKVKFSDIRNDGGDFLVIDTLIRINPIPIE